jgi:hypothetical protein
MESILVVDGNRIFHGQHVGRTSSMSRAVAQTNQEVFDRVKQWYENHPLTMVVERFANTNTDGILTVVLFFQDQE